MANVKPIRGNILRDSERIWKEKKSVVMSEDKKETEQLRVRFPPHLLLAFVIALVFRKKNQRILYLKWM